MVFVDTSVWSLAFRRSKSLVIVKEVQLLNRLILEDVPIIVVGIVMQKLLSGLRETAQFKRLQNLLANFPVVLTTQSHHVLAAEIVNSCRCKGVATSATDCLIAAMCIVNEASLLTANKDFKQMAVYCGLKLYQGH